MGRLPRTGASIHGDYPAAWDLEPTEPVAAFRRHRGVAVPATWSDERADVHVDEHRQDRATGAYDETPDR
jgi:hypothetical protein